MGMVKDFLYVLEDIVWSEVSEAIEECDSLEEASQVSMDIAEYYDLHHFVNREYIMDTVHEMYNEFWASKV